MGLGSKRGDLKLEHDDTFYVNKRGDDGNSDNDDGDDDDDDDVDSEEM